MNAYIQYIWSVNTLDGIEPVTLALRASCSAVWTFYWEMCSLSVDCVLHLLRSTVVTLKMTPFSQRIMKSLWENGQFPRVSPSLPAWDTEHPIIPFIQTREQRLFSAQQHFLMHQNTAWWNEDFKGSFKYKLLKWTFVLLSQIVKL